MKRIQDVFEIEWNYDSDGRVEEIMVFTDDKEEIGYYLSDYGKESKEIVSSYDPKTDLTSYRVKNNDVELWEYLNDETQREILRYINDNPPE